MLTKQNRYVRRGLYNKRERKNERDREDRLMPRPGITVSFYKLNNYLRFQNDDYWVTSTYCVIILLQPMFRDDLFRNLRHPACIVGSI